MNETLVREPILTLNALRRPSPHFQRAINLKYDLGNRDYITGYIPTPNAAEALIALLGATRPESAQRSHLLHGAYGSGKSLFAAVLAAILSQDSSLNDALDSVLVRLSRDFPDVAEIVAAQFATGPKLLPVVLSGDEGGLSVALARALDRTLFEIGLGDIRPLTAYRAALETIQVWRDDYPATYDQLAHWLEERGRSRDKLMQELRLYQPQAYELFLDAYPHLTSGALFDRHNGQPVVEAYRQTAKELVSCGYKGIAVLWDEFGRFMEARAGEPSGADAALLQEFAEACNRSESNQIHLLLIAHKELGQYASHLPEAYQQEWKRIAGRFRQVDISGDPEVSYRLIAEALGIANSEAWNAFLNSQERTMSHLLEQVYELGLFRLLTEERIRELVLEGAYPLHPLTTYCLPRLSNQVAQNERTLFTFLASDEPETLGQHMTQITAGTPEAWVRLDQLWDYFANAIRADIGTGGVHFVWASVEASLRKLPIEDLEAARLIKSLGVLTIVGEAGGARATTDLLCFALGIDDRGGRQAVEERLRYLVRRKTLILNQVEGIWELFSGSGVDLESKLAEEREIRLLNPLQRRQLLERILPPHHYRARRFNQMHGMTRFFWSLYRSPQELDGVNWDLALREIRVNGLKWEFSDGFVVYVLATNEAELSEAHKLAQSVNHPQVLFVVPRRPLLIMQHLIDWLVIDELNHDARFKEQDPERLQRELDFYLAESVAQLQRALAPLTIPSASGAAWYYMGKPASFPTNSDARVSRFLSKICDEVFRHTPQLANELLNKREPSSIQVRAANKVIDALLVEETTEDLNLPGHGPDVMALKTILKAPGILHKTDNSEWEIGRPGDVALAQAWDEIEQFLQQARSEPQPFDLLLQTLQSPPYGLRLGILPLLIAAKVREYLWVTTIRKGKKVIIPLTSTAFTDLCRRPANYAIEIGAWDAGQEAMRQVLEKRFGGQVLDEERRNQPLSYLSLGMLRWLQSQSRYARETNSVSADAVKLRNLIRLSNAEPARVLFGDLPTLLDDDSVAQEDVTYKTMLEQRLSSLLDEIATTPDELQRRLDQFAVEHFASDSPTPRWHGRAALNYWLTGVEQQASVDLEAFRFGDARAEGLVRTVRMEEDAEALFWDQLSIKLIGVSLRDWNDQSEETFKAQLLGTRKQVEHEVMDLSEEGEMIQLQIHLPDTNEHTYYFRPADLSPQGQRILQNFKSTLQIAGRPLSPDERRQVVLALLHYVLGEKDA